MKYENSYEFMMLNKAITSLSLLALIIILLTLPMGCDKKKESPVVNKGGGGEVTKPEDLPSDIPVISGEAKTIISDDVRKKWKGIKLVVEDRERKSIDEYSVNIGGEFNIPESKIFVRVVEFLPDLKIDDRPEGTIFTSETNELKNPAAHLIIKEDGRILFKGWLFSLFPDIHPFKHDRFGIILKEPIGAT